MLRNRWRAGSRCASPAGGLGPLSSRAAKDPDVLDVWPRPQWEGAWLVRTEVLSLQVGLGRPDLRRGGVWSREEVLETVKTRIRQPLLLASRTALGGWKLGPAEETEPSGAGRGAWDWGGGAGGRVAHSGASEKVWVG